MILIIGKLTLNYKQAYFEFEQFIVILPNLYPKMDETKMLITSNISCPYLGEPPHPPTTAKEEEESMVCHALCSVRPRHRALLRPSRPRARLHPCSSSSNPTTRYTQGRPHWCPCKQTQGYILCILIILPLPPFEIQLFFPTNKFSLSL